MNLLPKDSNGCPFLQVAPMEGVADRCFRKAIAAIGGFDEAVREFLRVPANAHIKSLASQYVAAEIAPYPLAAQLMGADPALMGLMAREMQHLGAPRIDLNCGCPSNTVTGRGAGSSLLKDPNYLYTIAKEMVHSVTIPVTLKMRSGYEDTSLFKENLLAAQESGVRYITLHPRTKVDGYGPPAKWELIAEAKSLLSIPVVGNGDILTVEDALKMINLTKCDALMIGRGCVINPFLFHEIRNHFKGEPYKASWIDFNRFFEVFINEMPKEISEKSKLNKMKQLMSLIFKGNSALLAIRDTILRSTFSDLQAFLEFAIPLLQERWNR